MSNNNAIVDLKKCKDKDGGTFYVGKMKAPVLIDASKGIAFLIFIADEGEEQLQIALMDQK